jgi:ATP-dependent Clp protease ATP-binding subunit ClpB
VLSSREKYFKDNFNANATFKGFTALHYAALLNDTESLKILIQYGANPFIKSASNHRPIDLVSDHEVYDLLKEYEKNVSYNILTYHKV